MYFPNSNDLSSNVNKAVAVWWTKWNPVETSEVGYLFDFASFTMLILFLSTEPHSWPSARKRRSFSRNGAKFVVSSNSWHWLQDQVCGDQAACPCKSLVLFASTPVQKADDREKDVFVRLVQPHSIRTLNLHSPHWIELMLLLSYISAGKEQKYDM